MSLKTVEYTEMTLSFTRKPVASQTKMILPSLNQISLLGENFDNASIMPLRCVIRGAEQVRWQVAEKRRTSRYISNSKSTVYHGVRNARSWVGMRINHRAVLQ
jgi:hypothetical protein